MTRKWGDDAFTRRARAEGQVARSVYKLEEIDKRWHVLKPNQAVLELGAAPGSWSLYASKRIGPGGRLVAVDLKPLEVALPKWAESRVGDAFNLPPDALQGPFDVILSDMAPATMGDHRTDALRSLALCEAALELAEAYGRVGSDIVLKVLEGGDVPGLVRRMQQSYNKVERLRPKATRRHSTELFLVGRGRRQPSN